MNDKCYYLDLNEESEKEHLAELVRTQPVTVIADKDASDVEVIERPPYCKFCFNARVYEPTEEEQMNPFATELTDDNDGSSICIGHCHDKTRRFMINSGMGKPVNIEFDIWDNKAEQWYTVGKYYPKFCPECGRRLDEYENHNNND